MKKKYQFLIFFIKEITEVEALEDLLENEHLNESFRK
nr:Uncharacterized protein A9P81_1711 [Leptospira interrogans serovar Copenhageni/Icterohaemorrhagiae]